MNQQAKALPEIVSREAWSQAIAALREKEKAQTRQRDALNAERRRLPMVAITKDYILQSEAGPVRLLDLFDGRRQLILYHFMFGPDKEAGCVGCSMVMDNLGHLAPLYARDTAFAVVSRTDLAKIRAFQSRMGWTLPWYSSLESDFNQDFGVTEDGQEKFGVSVFLRDGERIYQTYFTTLRGVEYLGSCWSYLDLTPFGRQESWEDSPAGWPQTPTYEWMRHHDRY